MKAVKNKARLMMTVLGGADAVPMAERNRDRTTTIRVNDVTITRMAGAIDRIVIRAISCKARSVVPPVGPRSRLKVCACADTENNGIMPSATSHFANLKIRPMASSYAHSDVRFHLY